MHEATLPRRPGCSPNDSEAGKPRISSTAARPYNEPLGRLHAALIT